MGGRVVRLLPAKGLLGACFVLLWLYIVVSSLDGDWKGQPSMGELSTAALSLKMPQGLLVTTSRSSKITFIAEVKKARSSESVSELYQYFSDLAKGNSWREKLRSKRPSGIMMVYCDGKYAHLIEINHRESFTRIYAGTYWHSNPSSDTYCR